MFFIPFFLYYAAPFSRSHITLPMMGVSLLAIILAARLLGEKNGRYYLQIYVLAQFSLASSSLSDPSVVSLLLSLGLMLLIVAVALVLLTLYARDSRMVLHP
jgi:hypothetical protein